MSTELSMLAATACLLLVLTLIQGTRNVLFLGLSVAAGNQHGLATWQGWHDRLNRAIRNLIEAIAIFAPLVIATHLLDLTNDKTAFGAQLFFASRIAHAVLYVAGVPYARTGAWFAGVVGILIIAVGFFH